MRVVRSAAASPSGLPAGNDGRAYVRRSSVTVTMGESSRYFRASIPSAEPARAVYAAASSHGMTAPACGGSIGSRSISLRAVTRSTGWDDCTAK
jgi:hypothetical protein